MIPSNLRLLSLAVFGALTLSASADERHFTYTYETTTLPKGAAEFETWTTWKGVRSGGPNVDKFEFRHEFEVGITDHLQLGLYLPNWSAVSTSGGKTEVQFDSVGAELIYNLSNPTTDWLGSAVYCEVTGGPDHFSLEGKLLLQKNIGSWVVAWNGIVEAEWEGKGLNERVGVLEQSLGLGYQISPSFTVGAEAVHEVEFEDWSEAGEHVVSAGPNFSYRFKNAYVAVTGLFLLTDVEGEPDYQTRVIFGFQF
jgi:hypothetical protein